MAGQETSGSTPVYATFGVYKGKGALNVRPVKPQWTVLDNGAWKVDRWVCWLVSCSHGSLAVSRLPRNRGYGMALTRQ